MKSGASDQKSRIVSLSSAAHKVFVTHIDYEGLHVRENHCVHVLYFIMKPVGDDSCCGCVLQKGTFMARGLAYGQAKLANLLFVRYLSKLLAGELFC